MADISNVVFAAALAWHGAVEIAAGAGERGPWQQNESRYDYVDDPSVAIDERGEIAVAWVDQGRKDVFFNGVNVSRSPATFSWLPRIALAPPHKVYVLWQEIIFSGGSHGGDILFSRSEDGGATFSEPLNLSNSVAGDGKGRVTRDLWHNGSLDIVAGADGAVYAAWTEYEGALWFTRSSDGGRTFSDLIQVNHSGPARGPSLALGADRTVYLAWTDGDIHVARSADGGASFGKPKIVARSKAYSDAPKLAVDPSGTLHLVYSEDHQVRYTRSMDHRPRVISKAPAGFPALSVDAKGNLYVTWELFAGRRVRPHGLGFTTSTDGGRTFAPPGTVPQSADPAGAPNGSFQGLLMRKLAVNRRGDVAIVNSSLKDGEKSRVWLVRGSLQRKPQAFK